MSIKRRNFIQFSTLVAGSAIAASFQPIQTTGENGRQINIINSKTADSVPISTAERRERILKAQGFMLQNKIQAIILESGTALEYFTGVSWWPSERTTVAVIPATGDIKYVCPAFEEARFRELITIGKQVYTWQEDESPYQLIAHTFADSGIHDGSIGIEEELRFFIYDGIRKAAPGLNYVSADPVTIPCRIIKSPAELALMQRASDITVAAMTIAIPQLKDGVLASDISEIINQTHARMGATPDFALILFGVSSALPHGSIKPQRLKKGDIVLMDCGCRVNGYCSDITRTIVFGAEPTKRQQDVWKLEQKAQAAGFAAARIGNQCEMVDAAARQVITQAGFGPGYQLPGLPHRTGHGIGMDGHEWGNMVKGNQQLLQAGMCFSIEPTISIPGEFGVRMEDCAYMTEDGPKWFSQPALAIDKPFG